MNEKISINKFYIDIATEFFHSLITNASFAVSNSCKTEIIEFFLESVIYYNIRNSLICLRNVSDYGEI